MRGEKLVGLPTRLHYRLGYITDSVTLPTRLHYRLACHVRYNTLIEVLYAEGDFSQGAEY
jgi:hypothetical protein